MTSAARIWIDRSTRCSRRSRFCATASSGCRPRDLGYWLGYRIVRRYYEDAADKQRAVRDILGLTDFAAFLGRSGYAERMEM